MNTSRLLGLAAITVGVGGLGWYFFKGEGRTVMRQQAPGLQARPPGTIIPSTPRLTRSKPTPQKLRPSAPTKAQIDSLPPMSERVQRATAKAARTRRREQRATRRQALIDERYPQLRQ